MDVSSDALLLQASARLNEQRQYLARESIRRFFESRTMPSGAPCPCPLDL
jgi:hypothetical protein